MPKLTVCQMIDRTLSKLPKDADSKMIEAFKKAVSK